MLTYVDRIGVAILPTPISCATPKVTKTDHGLVMVEGDDGTLYTSFRYLTDDHVSSSDSHSLSHDA